MNQITRLWLVFWLGLFIPAAATAQSTSDSDRLPAGLAVDRIMQRAAQMPRLHSVLISYRGETVVERYFAGRNASQPANLKSASKSVISALIGLAIQHGYIRDVDQPLSDFFPEYIGTDLETTVRSISVRNLLTMQAGLAALPVATMDAGWPQTTGLRPRCEGRWYPSRVPI